MKPNWSDAPPGAKYLAMDSDGTWYWYSAKPFASKSMWKSRDCEAVFAATNPPWKESLEPRP